MTVTQGGTDIMSHVMSLRSRKPTKKVDVEKTDEEAALISAEERLMEDEEVESVDEFGNPVVDMAKLDERNLSVAVSRSVLEMSGGESKGNVNEQEETENGGHRRYGLRMRRKTNHPDSPRSTDLTHVNRMEIASAYSGTEQASNTPGINDEMSLPTTVTPSQPIPPLSNTQTLPLRDSTHPELPAPQLERHPRPTMPRKPLHTSHTSHGVPNPLANMKTSRDPSPPIPPHTSSIVSSQVKIPSVSIHASTVPCPLPAVPCPLVTSLLPAPAPTVVPLLPQIELNTLEFSSTDLLPNRRGRIFSMDIDAAGLDFPDISVDNIASDFDSPALPPLPGLLTVHVGSSSDQQRNRQCQSGDPSTSVSTPMSAPVTAFNGRDRAMSFEFFSLGINADEPLPPVSEDGFIFQRPRGDSIIFDPVSFQDGGIHEEKVLFRSRENSLDILSKDEMAIMNAPMFVVPSIAPPPKPTCTPDAVSSSLGPASSSPLPKQQQSSSSCMTNNSAQMMATLPSSLNTTMNHATFQMDLLNKDGRIGIYLPDARRARIAKFHSKRKMRIWRKRIKYDCRKKLADSRPRIKGRFVKRSDMDED